MAYDQLIIFDLDDTLVDTSDIYWQARTRFVQELATEGLGPDEITELFEEIDTDHIREYGFMPDRYSRSMLATYNRIAHLLGHDINPSKLEKIKACGNIIMESYPNLIESATEVLTWASSRYKLALVTRGDVQLQQRKLEHLGLAKYFDLIEVVKHKDSDTFKKVMRDSGYRPERSWIVGDSIRTDINPGIQAGANCILYVYKHEFYHWRQEHGQSAIGPFYIANKLRDVISILESPASFEKVWKI